MKALTLWQPWATLVTVGGKRYETRGWRTNYRGVLAIHAAKSKKAHSICHTEPFCTVLKNAGYSAPQWLPHGQIIAICKLTAIYQVTVINATNLSQQELAFGDFTPGRYAWHLENIRRLELPIPARGKQGLWEWDYSEETSAMQRIIKPDNPSHSLRCE